MLKWAVVINKLKNKIRKIQNRLKRKTLTQKEADSLFKVVGLKLRVENN